PSRGPENQGVAALHIWSFRAEITPSRSCETTPRREALPCAEEAAIVPEMLRSGAESLRVPSNGISLHARNPERVTRAAILNAPHPGTLRRYARAHPRQALKSWYVAYFQLPYLPELGLRAGGFWGLRRALRRTLRPGTFTTEDFGLYREAWAQPGALTAMLNWYPRRA